MTPNDRARLERNQTCQQLARLRPLARKFIAQAAQTSHVEVAARLPIGGGSFAAEPALQAGATLAQLSAHGHP
jgi:hypothetical protein